MRPCQLAILILLGLCVAHAVAQNPCDSVSLGVELEQIPDLPPMLPPHFYMNGELFVPMKNITVNTTIYYDFKVQVRSGYISRYSPLENQN